MKLTISTTKLQDMVARASKGVGNNKLIPITSLICIEVKNNRLTLITTDATNYLYITEDKFVNEDFYAVVDANMFAKLVSKMTCDSIVLAVKDGVLVVKGNGTYKIELPLDETGQPIKYPNPYNEDTMAREQKINLSTIRVILETLKPALATTLEIPCYTGYYVGDSVIATDTYKIADMDIKLFDQTSLISSELMNLLSVMTSEMIQVSFIDGAIQFETPDCKIFGRPMEGIEDFAVEPITELVKTEFNSMCALPKNQLLQVLDRLSLFVGTYDKNAIRLTFTNTGLEISSKALSGVEIIPYVSSEEFRDFTCMIDVQMFTQEIKAISADVINLYYGEDNAIKLEDGNITIIVALLEDEDEDE